MSFNPKSLANLRQFRKGQSGNPNGRPPLVSTLIGNLPPDARERIYATLHYALKQPNHKALERFLSEQQDELGEYGFVLERASKELLGKYGWTAMMDILDRLFGKPRQAMEHSGSIDLGEKPVIVFGDETPACDAE